MTKEMKLFLPELISKFLASNQHPLTITKTANPDTSCLVLVNYSARKVCLVGDVKDPRTGKNKIGAASIDVNKWKWASSEGFSTDEMFDKLPDLVFKQVSPGDLHDLLV